MKIFEEVNNGSLKRLLSVRYYFFSVCLRSLFEGMKKILNQIFFPLISEKPAIVNPKYLAISVIILLCLFSLSECLASENGRFVFIKEGNIWIANTDGSGQRQLTFSGKDSQPVISPDGSLVIYTSGQNSRTGFGSLYRVPATGGNSQKMDIPGMMGSEYASFSSGGKSIVFVGISDVKEKEDEMFFATMSISILELKTNKVRNIISHKNTLLDAGYIYEAPSFSPDGKHIVYQHSGSDVSGGFAVIDLKGKTVFRFPKKISESTTYWRPQFLPDGKRILCYSPLTNEYGRDVIHIIEMSSGKKINIAEGANPVLLKNGKAIVMERWRNKLTGAGKSDLYYHELIDNYDARRIIQDALLQ